MLFTAASIATPLDDWWGGGSAPMLVIQGLQDSIAPPENWRDPRERYRDRVLLIELPDTALAVLPEAPEADRFGGDRVSWWAGFSAAVIQVMFSGVVRPLLRRLSIR